MNLLSLPKRAFRLILRKIRGDSLGYLKQCRRLVHIGANNGQEREHYHKLKLEVLWIEALPDAHARLLKNLEGYPKQSAAQALLTDVDDQVYEFNVASNEGASSSIFDFKEHAKIWPDISFVNKVSLKSRRLATLFQERSIPLNHFDAAILDVQGAELLVLKGAGDYLSGFKYVQCEASDFEAYAGACNVSDLITYMAQHSFKLERKVPFASREGVGVYYDLVFRRI
ncbi:MAG: FkbM family methyltransferase [Verrucomicrobiaceae bacterium]|nr:FkbM family methyltransferase [Verrucomicrobiaceae bacterium]